MIKILNENFAKQVRKELVKKKRIYSDVYVHYNIESERKGTITIKIYDGFDECTEISTDVEIYRRITSNGIHDGKPIKRIVFKTYPTDTVLDIITHDHIIESWKNAYGWDMQIIDNGITKDTMYHISHIHFYNANRSKSTTIKEICFNGYEMIQTEEEN